MIKVISDNTKQLLFYFEFYGREVCGVARYIDAEPLEFRLNWGSAWLGAFILMKRYCGNACGDNPCKKGISYESRIVGLKLKRYCGNGLCKNCAVMQ